jgi:hypothetical protein
MVISRKTVCFQAIDDSTFGYTIAKHLVDHRVMNQKESAVTFGYEPSEEEIQKVVMEWARATDAFHHRFAKLDRVINYLQAAPFPLTTAHRARLQRLIELRQHMGDVMMTLLLDMSGQRPGRSKQLSKPGQLHSHASLMDELSREIDAELMGSVTTVAQA